MIDPIIQSLNRHDYKYKLLSRSCGSEESEKYDVIRIDAKAASKTYNDIFNILKEECGDPVRVHIDYGYIFVKNGKYITYDVIEKVSGSYYLEICMSDKIPSGKAIDYDSYVFVKTALAEQEEKNIPEPVKYLYYDFRNGRIAREKSGNKRFARERFEFYIFGEWMPNEHLSLCLSDAIMDFGDYSVFDYEELTEDEAMRRIATQDNK